MISLFFIFSFFLIFAFESFADYEFPSILTQPKICKSEAGKIKQVPDKPEKSVEYFLILLCAGDKKRAENFLRSAEEKFSNNFIIKYNLGNFYIMEGKYDFAIF